MWRMNTIPVIRQGTFRIKKNRNNAVLSGSTWICNGVTLTSVARLGGEGVRGSGRVQSMVIVNKESWPAYFFCSIY